jgi:hypothetical protein
MALPQSKDTRFAFPHKTKLNQSKRFEARMTELQQNGLDCDPIQILMEIASGKKKGKDGLYREIIGAYSEEGNPIMLDSATRVKAASELLNYVYPKRKSVEISGNEGTPITFAVVAEAIGEPAGTLGDQPADRSLEESADGPPTLIGEVQPEDESADTEDESED